MITMRMECAIGVEPKNRRFAGVSLGRLATRTGVAWDGLEPSRGLLQRQVGYQLPHQAKKESAREDSNLRPRGSKPLTLT